MDRRNGVRAEQGIVPSYMSRVAEKLAAMDRSELELLVQRAVTRFFGEDGDTADDPIDGGDLVEFTGQLLAPFHPESLKIS